MAAFFITTGWLGDLLATVWIVLILIDLVWSWFQSKQKEPGLVRQWFAGVANPPVNLLRRTVPTVYRRTDFAPWLAILLLVLIKTFIFRAMIYWGMLHRPPLG